MGLIVLRRLWFVIVTFFFWHLSYAQSEEKDLQGDFELELQFDNRFFFKDGLYESQERNFLSLAAQPEYNLEWGKGNHIFKISLFGRWDQHDDNRTHFDVRELYYQRVKNNWELSIGLKKVFWGVTESVHLVDVINQTDQVESFDGEQKLGQPMVHYSNLTNFGNFELFYLPYQRKRQFPAREGRVRFPEVVEREDFDIDSDMEEWRPSFAFRWSHYFGPVDIGISHFYGVGREPLFTGLGTESQEFFYPIMNQTGIDVQAVTGPMLWKVESIYRDTEFQDFLALAVGAEYTFSNIASKGLDIGVLLEYLYDERDDLAISGFANDLFIATRLAFNDVNSTEILGGMVYDLDHKSRLFSVETSRRIGDSWKVEIEARIFDNLQEAEFLHFFRDDSFLQFGLSKFF
ncbi:hypothetical protein QQ020_27475 [Fulvivirgaceae bacterium BMA12]|uniref:Porin n=1 Tax=Agaribacillus aureus TaxID=3051825 RepID=A0ABT8LDJ4_9BACT|nr:hypothetical protein [Fulvivirgaceae bacterium BMA12]